MTGDLVRLSPPEPAGDLFLQVHASGDRMISPRLRASGVWEPYESHLVQRLLGPGDVFVDVGANLGYFTVLGAQRVGARGRVFAFEPDPANFRLLRGNVARNGFAGRVSATRAGLGIADARGQLFLSEDNLGDHQVFSTDPARRSVPVRLLAGAAFLAPRLSRIDLLKVDTQGAEYAVIAGLMPLLQRLAVPPRTLIELTPLSLRQAGHSGRALIELLAELGQPLWIVDHVEHRLVPESAEALARWCDNVDAVAGDAGFMNVLVGEPG